MPTDVIMPSLGFDMTEGKVARWLKQEGDKVEKGEVIAEVETEKAVVEIEAAVSGVLRKIAVKAGDTVAVGTVIGVIAGAGEEEPKEPKKAEPKKEAGKEPKKAEPKKEEARKEEPKKEETGKEEREEPAPAERRIKASPIARRMAGEAGIDLAGIEGSGPGGRVMERDVQAAIDAREAPAEPAEPAEKERAPVAGTAPQSRMRQAIARRMAESKAKAPHFYVTIEIRMDEAMKLRKQLNELSPAGEPVSVNDLVVAAAARALPRFPELNASYREGSLERHSRIDIGIAVAVPDGLITPVLRGADTKPLRAISAESKALSERARTGRLRADDLGPGTFTISNLGMFDVDEFIAIINPPETAILAVGAVTRRPVAEGDEVRVAPVMKATLSVDHRAADGAQAGRFLQEFRKLLENPVNLLTG